MIFDGTDNCASPRLIPETAMQEFLPNRPPRTIPRIPEGNPYKEWTRAIRGGVPAGSNFEYSVPQTEMVLLGCVALMADKKLQWDTKNLRLTNWPEGQKYIKPAFRAGWAPEDHV